MRKTTFMLAALAALLPACSGKAARQDPPPPQPLAEAPPERHLANLRQLTFGGENAEAYFSADGTKLVFQSTRPPYACDQIFTMSAADGSDVKTISTGKGRTTCAYFFPDGKSVVYSSTHLASADCPPKPDYSRGYVWALYDGYDIFLANADGTDLQPLTQTQGYDAEATISADGKKIVYRAHHPKGEKDIADYRALLGQGLIRPTVLEIFVMDADGSNKRQVTHLGAASFAPFFHPDGRRIIFASNVHDPKGRNFDLYVIGEGGKGLERVTFNETFDGFPMFSPDGKRLVFASNRNGRARGETNVFIADWVD